MEKLDIWIHRMVGALGAFILLLWITSAVAPGIGIIHDLFEKNKEVQYSTDYPGNSEHLVSKIWVDSVSGIVVDFGTMKEYEEFVVRMKMYREADQEELARKLILPHRYW